MAERPVLESHEHYFRHIEPQPMWRISELWLRSPFAIHLPWELTFRPPIGTIVKHTKGNHYSSVWLCNRCKKNHGSGLTLCNGLFCWAERIA
jgi:hypothetical protein